MAKRNSKHNPEIKTVQFAQAESPEVQAARELYNAPFAEKLDTFIVHTKPEPAVFVDHSEHTAILTLLQLLHITQENIKELLSIDAEGAYRLYNTIDNKRYRSAALPIPTVLAVATYIRQHKKQFSKEMRDGWYTWLDELYKDIKWAEKKYKEQILTATKTEKEQKTVSQNAETSNTVDNVPLQEILKSYENRWQETAEHFFEQELTNPSNHPFMISPFPSHLKKAPLLETIKEHLREVHLIPEEFEFKNGTTWLMVSLEPKELKRRRKNRK